MPGADTSFRVSVVLCKPYDNSHDSSDPQRFLPAGLTPYVLNNYNTKSSPYLVTKVDVPVPLERLEVENTTSQRSVRGRAE